MAIATVKLMACEGRGERTRLAQAARNRLDGAMNVRGLLALLLPYRGTTRAEVLRAIQRCGLQSDDIVWDVRPDGSLAIAPPKALGRQPMYEKVRKLLKWARRNRVRVEFLADEQFDH